MIKRIQFILCLVSFSVISQAQYTQIGNGGFASSNFGPIVTDTLPAFYSRYAYIYPAATVTTMVHGDTIRALGFRHLSFDSIFGNPSIKIYIKSTAQSDFGAGALNWLAESRNGMTLAYDGPVKDILGNSPRDVIFRFNQISGYKWDTTGGRTNFELLVEYSQTTNQVGRMAWYCESSFYVPGFTSNNETKRVFGSSTSGMDSIATSSTIIKPTLTIYHPRFSDELVTKHIYSLGTIPILMKRSDSIKVVVSNIGFDTVTNRKAYLTVSGANTFLDSIVIPSIAPYESKFIYFDSYLPSNLGMETLTVKLDADGDTSNNTIVKNRISNYNEYSHVDPFAGSNGGIGFGGSTGDFVAKFYVDGASYLNQIKVDFSLAGRDFQLGMWEDDGPGGQPGTELFISDSTVSTAGTFIMPVLPRVQVSGGFYIGIRQTSNTNVAFSYQRETPVRPNTFFFTAPAGDSAWTSFSPGYNFNFNIKPRLQVANDLGVLNILSPTDGDSINYSATDSLDLNASIVNYGYQDQNSFIVKYEILNKFNQLMYTNSQVASLQADDTLGINFGKFSKYNLGKFTVRVSTSLNTDSVSDNNSKTSVFYLVKDHDIAVDRIFSPINNDTFDLNREYFQPTVRIINYGVVTQNNFKVVGELVNQFGNIVNYQETRKSLASENSLIFAFDSMKLKEEGSFVFRAYTLLDRDSFPINDTSKIIVHSKKIDDLQIRSIISPENNKRYALGEVITPYVNYRNDGRSDQDSTYFYATIYGEDNSILYVDTVIIPTFYFSNGQALFKSKKFDSLGNYRLFVEVEIKNDQLESNDTLSSYFSVVTGDDIKLVKVLSPASIVKVGSGLSPVRLVIYNNGINTISDAPISFNIENETGANIFSDTLLLSLVPFTLDTMIFKDISLDIVGDYYLTVINNWINEDLPSNNDTIRSTYIVRYEKDIEIGKHLVPALNDTVEFNDIVYPSIQITNVGIDTAKNIKIVTSILDKTANVVYQDTFSLNELSPNRASNFTSAVEYEAIEVGSFTMKSDYISGDDNTANNILTTSFEVVKRNDVVASSLISPFQNEDVERELLYMPRAKFSNVGLNNLTGVEFICNIYFNGDKIYSDNVIEDISAGEELSIAFDSSLTHTTRGGAIMEFIVNHSDDQDLKNDTISGEFNFVSTLGIDDLKRISRVKIFPNPFNHKLVITSSHPISTIRIVTIDGKLIEEYSNLNSLEETLELSGLASGNYVVEIATPGLVERIPILKK